MKILQHLDPGTHEAWFLDLKIPGLPGQQELAPVAAFLQRLGFGEFELTEGDPPTGSLAAREQLQLRWMFDNQGLQYFVRLPHRPEADPLVALYTALALATYGLTHEMLLLQLRLVVCELSSNVLEHGCPLHGDAHLQLRLELGRFRIRGWIQDECQPFNPLRYSDDEPAQRVTLRARRGYGIMMVARMLDKLEHEYNSTGNLVSFVKKVKS